MKCTPSTVFIEEFFEDCLRTCCIIWNDSKQKFDK